MKRTIQFTIYQIHQTASVSENPTHVPDALLEELKRRWPQMECKNHYIKFRLEWDSQMMTDVFAFLWESQGIRPVLEIRPVGQFEKNEFTVSGVQEFSREELNRAKFLRLSCSGPPIHPISHPLQESDGRYNVTPSKVNKSKVFGDMGDNRGVFCKSELKHTMLASKFRGLKFCGVNYRGRSMPRPEQELWQVCSDVVMPGVMNPLIDEYNRPFGEEAKSCNIADLFVPHLLRYFKTELDYLGDFDIAMTREHFHMIAPPFVGVPWLIVSQRLRLWLEEKKLPGIAFTPIAIEG